MKKSLSFAAALSLALSPAFAETRGPVGVALSDVHLHALVPRAVTYDAFGDSITAGYAASTPSKNYVSLIGAFLGVKPTNHGVSGNEAVDTVPIIYQQAVSPLGGQMFSYMIGTNDDTFNGNNIGNLANFQQTHQAELAWLAMPNKVLGQSSLITYSGSWAPSPLYGGAVSEVSTTPGDTATLSLYGSTLYFAYGAEDGNTGSFDLTIDGVDQGVTTAAGVAGTLLKTNAGATHSSLLQRFTDLGDTFHTIVVTNVSPAGQKVWLDWAGSPSGANYANGPQVIAGGIPINNNTSNLRTTYAPLVKQDVGILQADGLQVGYAAVPSYMVPSDLFTDGTHPIDIGETHIAAAFEAAMVASAPTTSRTAYLQEKYLLGRTWRGAVLGGNTSAITGSGVGNNIVGGGYPVPNTMSNVGQDNIIVAGFGNTIQLGATNTSSDMIGAGNTNIIQYGSNDFIGAGTFNTVSGFSNVILGGDHNSVSGTDSQAGGLYSTDRGRFGITCYGAGYNVGYSGNAQQCTQTLRALTNSTAGLTARLTADGLAASLYNSVNIQPFYSYSVKITLIGIDLTNPGNSYMWESGGILYRASAVTSVAFTPMSSPATITQMGSQSSAGSGTSVAMAADVTMGGLSLTVTSPGDAWDWVAKVSTTEVH